MPRKAGTTAEGLLVEAARALGSRENSCRSARAIPGLAGGLDVVADAAPLSAWVRSSVHPLAINPVIWTRCLRAAVSTGNSAFNVGSVSTAPRDSTRRSRISTLLNPAETEFSEAFKSG